MARSEVARSEVGGGRRRGTRHGRAVRREARELGAHPVPIAAAQMAAAIIELVEKSGASLVGCGFLIEKVYDQGRAMLHNDVMIEPLVRVMSVKDGVIGFEEGPGSLAL